MKIVNDPNCDLCELKTPDTYLHMMWECPGVLDFWGRVVAVITELLGMPIPCEPIPLLLNDDSQMTLNEKQRKLWLAGLTAAKKLIVQRWLPPHKLPTKQWLEFFHDVIMLELSTARVNKAKETTLGMWRGAAAEIEERLRK